MTRIIIIYWLSFREIISYQILKRLSSSSKDTETQNFDSEKVNCKVVKKSKSWWFLVYWRSLNQLPDKWEHFPMCQPFYLHQISWSSWIILIGVVELIVRQSPLIIKTADMSVSAIGQFVYFMYMDIALIPSTGVSEKFS